jgi:hypothetical protein
MQSTGTCSVRITVLTYSIKTGSFGAGGGGAGASDCNVAVEACGTRADALDFSSFLSPFSAAIPAACIFPDDGCDDCVGGGCA